MEFVYFSIIKEEADQKPASKGYVCEELETEKNTCGRPRAKFSPRRNSRASPDAPEARTAAHPSPAAGAAGRRTLGGRAASSLGPTGPTFRSTAPKVRRFSEYYPDQPNVSPKSQKFRNVHAMLHNPTKTPVNRSLTSRTRKMKPFRKSRYHGTRFFLNVSFVVSFFSFFFPQKDARARASAPPAVSDGKAK